MSLAESQAYGSRLADIESALFGLPSAPAAVTVSLLLAGWMRSASADGDAASARDQASELLAMLPPAGRQNLFRSGRTAFDRWRLQRLQRGAGLADVQRIPPLRALLLGWSAARLGRRPD